MASSYTGLGTELMTTGENAGTWGTTTNTNLQILEQISGGYVEKSIAGGAQTTTLSVSDGSTGAELAHRIIKFTGTITGNQIVTIPLDVQQMFILVNGTSGAYTVQFKYASGSGSSLTFGTTDKGTKIVYATADDGTNPNLVDTGISTNTLTGVTGDITIDSPADIVFDADGADFKFKDGGTEVLRISNSSSDVVIKPTVDAKDIIFQQYDGTEVARVEDGAQFNVSATTASSSSTTGALITGGGLGVAADANIGDDLTLRSDSAVLGFGADNDTTLTHTDGTGLTLNSTNKLTFGDAATYINQSSDGVMTVAGEATIDLTASTAVLVSNDLKLDSDNSVIAFGADSEITLTHVPDDGLILKHVGTGDGKEPSLTFQAGDNDIAQDDVLGSIFFQAPDEGAGTDAILVAAGIEAVSEGDFSSSNNATKLSFKTGASEAATEKVAISSAGNLSLIASNTELRFYEGSNYVGFEAPALSADQIWVLPTGDGSNGQHLTTDGSGTLSWASASVSSLAADDIGAGDAAVTIGNGSTSADVTIDSGDDVVIDAAGGNIEFKDAGTTQLTLDMDGTGGAQVIQLRVDSDDLIFKQFDGTTVLTLDDDTTVKVATDLTVGDDLTLLSDSAVLGFGADTDTTLTHTDGTGLTLNSTNKLTFGDAATFINQSSDGVMTVAGEATIDLTASTAVLVSNDLKLDSDSAVLGFGADNDTTLTHTDGTGLTLNSTNKLCFNDASQFVQGSSGTVLSLGATDEIDLTATAIDINGTCDISGTFSLAGTNITSTAAELNKLDGVGTIKEAGLETIWVPANSMTPTNSNGCADIAKVETTAGRPDLNVLDFDDGSDEHAQFAVAFPKSWNLGTITFQVFWTSTATDTDGVTWGLQGVAMADNQTQDVAYGTGVTVDDACQGAAEELYVTAVSGAVTIAGTPADDDLTYFRIYRDVSDANDTAAEDARLLGCKIFFTTDAKNDS